VSQKLLEITLIFQPARSDVKIGLVRAHGNRLLCDNFSTNATISIFVEGVKCHECYHKVLYEMQDRHSRNVGVVTPVKEDGN